MRPRPARTARRGLAYPMLLALTLTAVAPALRAEPRADLRAVEDAYREVDFDAVRRLGEAAIRSGGHDPSSMARLEFLLGVANAALDRPEEAKRAFTILLGIDPTQKLDRELSPRLRAPYLEARGFWSSHRDRLSASASLEAGTLRVSLSDPATMVRQLRVSVRAAGEREFRSALHPAAATVRIPRAAKDKAEELEVAVALIDEFGNTLGEHGTLVAPQRLSWAGLGATVPEQRAVDAATLRQPNTLLPSALLVLGAASTATGIYFHVQRERAAKDWNGRACERPGATRGEQCADVESRLRRDEWLTVGFYTGAGALLTLGVITWVAGRAPSRERAVSAFSCDAVTSSTPGVWCAGRF